MKKKDWLNLLVSEKNNLTFFETITILNNNNYELLDVKTCSFGQLRIKSVTRVFGDFAIVEVNCCNSSGPNLHENCILWCGCVYWIV